jgi:NADH-quinone oxidoreductase subunit A
VIILLVNQMFVSIASSVNLLPGGAGGVPTAASEAALPVGGALAGMPVDDAPTMVVLGIILFMLAAFAMGFAALRISRFVTPPTYQPEKAAAYECGEPAVGPAWVQFDLRFYALALVFIVFDVEVALLWPWAVVFGEGGALRGPAFWAFFIFFALIGIPFLYEWKSGYLDWVRSRKGQPEIQQ